MFDRSGNSKTFNLLRFSEARKQLLAYKNNKAKIRTIPQIRCPKTFHRIASFIAELKRLSPNPRSAIAKFLISMIETLSKWMALYFMEDTNTIAFPAVERKPVKKDQVRIIMCSEIRCLSSGKGSMVLLERLSVRIIVGEINPFGFPILVVASIENYKIIV